MDQDFVFVLNDERQENTYGFRIRTAGIDTSRFEQNPVMLADHRNSVDAVLGRWQDLKKDGPLLTARAEFDTTDEKAAKVAEKVKKGYLRGVSMGIRFSPDDLIKDKQGWILDKCELMEASIVGVPSNRNAVRLYTTDNKPVDEKDLKLMLQNKTDMKELKLSAQVMEKLGLSADADVQALEARILELLAQHEQTKQKLNELLRQREQEKLQAVTEQVNELIAKGAITADEKDEYIQLGVAHPEIFRKVTDKLLKAQTGLAGGIHAPKGDALPKTLDEFQAMPLEKQLAFKEAHPDKYIELVNNEKN